MIIWKREEELHVTAIKDCFFCICTLCACPLALRSSTPLPYPERCLLPNVPFFPPLLHSPKHAQPTHTRPLLYSTAVIHLDFLINTSILSSSPPAFPLPTHTFSQAQLPRLRRRASSSSFPPPHQTSMAAAQASAGASNSSNNRRKRWLKLGAALLLFLGVLVIAITLGIEHGQKKVSTRREAPWTWVFGYKKSAASTTRLSSTNITYSLPVLTLPCPLPPPYHYPRVWPPPGGLEV